MAAENIMFKRCSKNYDRFYTQVFCEKDHRATEQSLNDREKIANNERQVNDCDLRI